MLPTQLLKKNRDKWHEFLASNELGEVSLHDYYCKETPEFHTSIYYEHLANEIFQDAVEVGALELPEPYKADDFCLVHIFGPNLDMGTLGVIFVNERDLEAEAFDEFYLSGKMYDAEKIIGWMANAVNHLFVLLYEQQNR